MRKKKSLLHSYTYIEYMKFVQSNSIYYNKDRIIFFIIMLFVPSYKDEY